MPATCSPETTVEQLTEAIDHLARHVDVLRRVLDEIREDFQWALQNDRFALPQTDARPQSFRPSAVLEATNLVDHLTGGIEQVTHGLRDTHHVLAQDLDEQRVAAALARKTESIKTIPPVASPALLPIDSGDFPGTGTQRSLFAGDRVAPDPGLNRGINRNDRTTASW